MDHVIGRFTRGVLIAAAYALLFYMLRVGKITLDQWYLPAGLRVAALLLLPRYYWPFLVAGEAAALLNFRIQRLENDGVVYALLSSFTSMPLVAGIIRVLEGKRGITDAPQKLVLLAAVTAVGTATLSTFLTLGLMHNVRGTQDWTSGYQYLLGDFLGILTLAPLVLLWHQRNAIYPFPRKLGLDTTAALAYTLVLFSIAIWFAPGTEKNLARAMLIAPAVVLTVLHGWRGAAVGVVIANTALAMTIKRSTTDGNTDPDAMMIQVGLAVSAVALMTLGATISRYYRNASTYGAGEARALEIARRSFVSSEKELERRVEDLHHLVDEVSVHLSHAAQHLKNRGHSEAALEVQNFRVISEGRIRRELHSAFPSHIATGGLYAAIESIPVTGKWGGQSKVLTSLRGDDSVLGPELQLMAYRALDDVIALLAITGHAEITIRARCRRIAGHSGIAVCITTSDGIGDAIDQVGDLDASGRALAYRGRIRRRGHRIHLLMREPEPLPSDPLLV